MKDDSKKQIVHPQFEEANPDFKIIRLAQKGERHVRGAGTEVLPKTSGMKKNASLGGEIFNAYKGRARFYPVVDEFVDGVTGLAFDMMPECDLPDDGKEVVTKNGLNAHELAQQTLENTSLIGRHILVNDATPAPESKPYIAQYAGESLVNWETDDYGNFIWCRFVEQYDANNNPRDRDMQPRFREYTLTDQGIIVTLLDEDDKKLEEDKALVVPVDANGDIYFPVTVIGSRNNKSDIDKMPVLKTVEAAVSAYKLSADQRQGLYGLAQPTPTATGVTQEEVDNIKKAGLGVGGFLASGNESAKFGMLQHDGQSLGQITDEIKAELELADKYAIGITQKGSGVEATETVQIKTKSQRATVWTLFDCASNGISRALTIWNKWGTAGAKDVVYLINTDFSQAQAEATMITALSNGINAGTTAQSVLDEYLLDSGMTDKTAEEQAEERATQTDLTIEPENA